MGLHCYRKSAVEVIKSHGTNDTAAIHETHYMKKKLYPHTQGHLSALKASGGMLRISYFTFVLYHFQVAVSTKKYVQAALKAGLAPMHLYVPSTYFIHPVSSHPGFCLSASTDYLKPTPHKCSSTGTLQYAHTTAFVFRKHRKEITPFK